MKSLGPGKALKVLMVVLAAIIAFSGSGAASDFAVEPKTACVQTILTKCQVGAETSELPNSCTGDGFGDVLHQELDAVANNSVDCSKLDSGELQSVEKPSDPLKLLLTVLLPVLYLAPVLIPLGLAIYYGKGRVEKLALSIYWLVSMILIPIAGYAALFTTAMVMSVFSFSIIITLLIASVAWLAAVSGYTYLTGKFIRSRTSKYSWKLFSAINFGAILFFVSLLWILRSTTGNLAAL